MTDFVSHLDITDEAKAMLISAAVDTMLKRRNTPWTQADIDVLRRHYPGGGAVACRSLLPHRTPGSIHEKAKQLGLKVKGSTRNHLLRYSNSPHIDAAIRRYYLEPRKGGLSRLAIQVNRPRQWISARARYLGVTQPRFQEAAWSEAEIDIIRQHASKTTYAIARILTKAGYRRTSGGVRQKLLKMRCDRSDDDTYSACGLADLFGVDEHLVLRWIDKGWLKAQIKPSESKRRFFSIHHNAVRRFVIENVGAIDIRRCDKHWFVDLLTGK